MMRNDRMGMNPEFGSRLTWLGKRILLIYGIIYVLELLMEHWFQIPIYSYLSLYPYNHGNFHVWQIVSHPFIHDPRSPFSFIITCIVFYFFSGPVEDYFGVKRFLILFYTSALGGLICGLAFSNVVGFNAPFSGMMPSLLSLIVVFGLMNPEATILLMFILPVKAKYLSYGTIIITFLTFLAKANPSGAYHLGGILFGYLYFKGWENILDIKRIQLKYFEWKIKRKKSRFQVIEGGKDKEDIKKKPTYH